MPLLAARMKRGRGDDQVHSDGGEKGTLQARSRLPGGGVTTRNQMSLTFSHGPFTQLYPFPPRFVSAPKLHCRYLPFHSLHPLSTSAKSRQPVLVTGYETLARRDERGERFLLDAGSSRISRLLFNRGGMGRRGADIQSSGLVVSVSGCIRSGTVTGVYRQGRVIRGIAPDMPIRWAQNLRSAVLKENSSTPRDSLCSSLCYASP
jgi:hypothetical protein